MRRRRRLVFPRPPSPPFCTPGTKESSEGRTREVLISKQRRVNQRTQESGVSDLLASQNGPTSRECWFREVERYCTNSCKNSRGESNLQLGALPTCCPAHSGGKLLKMMFSSLFCVLLLRADLFDSSMVARPFRWCGEIPWRCPHSRKLANLHGGFEL